MKQVVTFCLGFCLLGSLACGQEEAPSNYEHLKCYDQLIGSWVYEGPAVEDLEGIVEKGQTVRLRLSYRWILNKNVVETNFRGEVLGDGGFQITIKGLIGWDTAEGRIIEGGMDSIGGHGLSAVTYDKDTKTFTAENKGVDGQGKPNSSRTVVTIKDKDTMVMQAFDRKGEFGEGDGPALTYKRVERTRGGKKRN